MGENSYEVAANDLFWVPPDKLIDMRGESPSMTLSFVHFDIQFDPHRSNWAFHIPGGTTNLTSYQMLMHPKIQSQEIKALDGRIRSYNNRYVGELVDILIVESIRGQPYTEFCLSGLLAQIVGELLRGKQGILHQDNRHVLGLEHISDVIRDQCHETLSVGELAKMCHLSTSRFHVLFKQLFGCSTRTYIRRMRIRKAKELMFSSNKTLSEIAIETGFATVHSFSRAFSKEEGITPSTYRQCGSRRFAAEVIPRLTISNP